MSVVCSAAAILGASPANAEMNTAVSLYNDYRLRGYSLSDARPAVVVDVSYDASTGFYAAASGSIVADRREGLKPLGLIVNGGYATRLSSRIALDLGISHSTYSKYSDRAAARSYTETYVGIAGKLLSARLNVSPDYIKGGSAYAELNGSWGLGAKLSLTAHAGLMVPFRVTHTRYAYHHDIDWRLGLVRQVGPLSLQAAWSSVRPGRGGYRQGSHSRDALIIGFTYAL